jgi:ech hydrogenase subunit D
MKEETILVTKETVIGETAKIKIDGYRFVTMTCVELDENQVDVIYHFDKNLQLKHFRFTVPKDTLIPSISVVYQSAFLAENEIQDLFGIHFDNLIIDYRRTLYFEGETSAVPFCKFTVKRKEKSESSAMPAET